MGAYYFLACLLPPLPLELGERLPLSYIEIIGMIKRNIYTKDEPLLNAYLHSVDVVNWEHIDQGRNIFLEGGMLTRDDIETRNNLPPFLRDFIDEKERGAIRRPYVYDRLWELYYIYVFELAQKARCRFLLDFIPWEINLRNNLVDLRAKVKNTDAEPFTILRSLGTADLSSIMTQVKGKENPLLSEGYLDTERLKYISHCLGSNPFTLDAVLAYVSRLAIYSRWERINAPYEFYDFLYGGG
ncbi:MAG: DUF2764 family protein [Deltaproteobacteria bacterium]|nr:DUF2764 family protein [Deltaproteobacteria bacterium]